MGTLSNSFEGGTNGTTISAAGSGGASGDAFNSVTVDSTLTYTTASAAHGSVAALASGTSDAYVAWTSGLAGTSATAYARAYLRFASLPASNTNILRLLSSSNGIMGTVRINSAGTLGMLWGTGSLGGTTTGTVTLGAWFRVEIQVIAGTGSTGTMVMRVYWTPDATTPDQTITSTNVATGAANPTRLRCGILSNSAEVYFDDVALSDVDWIGPAGGGGGVSGTLAATLPHLTGAAVLGQRDAASLAATLPHLTASIASSGAQAGTLAATLPHLAASAAVSQIDGSTLTASLPHLGAAVQASETDPAAIAATLPRLAVALGTGTPPDTGTLAGTLPTLTSSTAVAQTDRATATAALPHLSAQAAASLTDGATAGLTLPSLVVDLRSSTPATDGTLAATLPALVISLGEEETISGRVAASLPTLRAALASAASDPAVLAGTLPALRAALSDAPLVVDELPDLVASAYPSGRLNAAVTVPGHLTATATPSGRLAVVVE